MLHCGKPRVFSKQRHINFDLPMLRRDWTRMTSLKIAEISLKGLLIFTVQVTASPCIFMTHGDTYFALHGLMRLTLNYFWFTFGLLSYSPTQNNNVNESVSFLFWIWPQLPEPRLVLLWAPHHLMMFYLKSRCLFLAASDLERTLPGPRTCGHLSFPA